MLSTKIAVSALGRALLPVFALASVTVLGEESTLTFPKTAVASAIVRDYACENQAAVSVAYVATADGDVFAYFIADERPHIFVRVLSDSGSRFVSGPYVWSTLGTTANLTRTDAPNASPLLGGCSVVAKEGKSIADPTGIDVR